MAGFCVRVAGTLSGMAEMAYYLKMVLKVVLLMFWESLTFGCFWVSYIVNREDHFRTTITVPEGS
jgi:hypothetical protein